MKIDLGTKMSEGPTQAAVVVKKKYYPTLHFETSEDHDIPKSGEMTIRFKKVESTSREVDGKTRYSCTVEAREIVDMKGRPADDDDEDNSPAHRQTENALNKLRQAKQKPSDEDEEY